MEGNSQEVREQGIKITWKSHANREEFDVKESKKKKKKDVRKQIGRGKSRR